MAHPASHPAAPAAKAGKPMAPWRHKLGAVVPWAAIVLGVCLLFQVFLAGAGMFADAKYLDWHKNFVHAFELLPLLMAIAAGIAKHWAPMWLSIAVLVLIEAQYPLAPFGDAPGMAQALHPVNALLIFGLTLALVLHRPPWRKTA
jgi:hypothetical protein